MRKRLPEKQKQRLRKPRRKELARMRSRQGYTEKLLLGEYEDIPVVMSRYRVKYCPHVLTFGASGKDKDTGRIYDGLFIKDIVVPNIENSQISTVVYVGGDEIPSELDDCGFRIISRTELSDEEVQKCAKKLLRERVLLYLNGKQTDLFERVFRAVLDVADKNREGMRHIDFMIDVERSQTIPCLPALLAIGGNYNIGFTLHFASVSSVIERYFEGNEWLALTGCVNALVQLSPFKTEEDIQIFADWANGIHDYFKRPDIKEIRDKDIKALRKMFPYERVVVVENFSPFYCIEKNIPTVVFRTMPPPYGNAKKKKRGRL